MGELAHPRPSLTLSQPGPQAPNLPFLHFHPLPKITRTPSATVLSKTTGKRGDRQAETLTRWHEAVAYTPRLSTLHETDSYFLYIPLSSSLL